MDDGEYKVIIGLQEKMYKIYSDFLTRVTNFEELVSVGSKLLSDFQQGLEFFRKPPINCTSKLVGSIIKANETERIKSYVKAGCINPHDNVHNMMNQVHACNLGLQDHLCKAKDILNEAKNLIDEAADMVQMINESLSQLSDHDGANEAVADDKEGVVVSAQNQIYEYALVAGIIYGMVEQDYVMQERIANALKVGASSGELESYTLMWSLRPYVNEEVLHDAWRLIR